ncbi:MAG: matrixin family metalloprotease, partial [Myxococcota bacterium]
MRFFLGALVLLAPSLAAAQLDSSVRECATDGTPTFYPRQGRWNTEPDFSGPTTAPFRYYFDSAGAPNLNSDNSEWEAVNAAFDEFNRHECTSTPNSFANLNHLNGGTFDFENQTLGGTSVSNRDEVGDEYDGDFLVSVANVIRWVDSGESFPGGEQTLAVTASLVLNTTQIVVQADMSFNSINFNWRTSSGGCTASDTCHDVYTIALHEVGHYIGLGHVDCEDAIMFSFHRGVDTETGLSENETAGLCALYPVRNFAITERVFGEACEEDDDCATGLVCVPEPDVGPPFAVCSNTCDSNAECPNGFLCRNHPDGYNFCVPGSDGSAPSSGGNGDPGTGRPVDLCVPCSTGSQCSNGVCAGVEGETPICTQTCAGSLGCPTGFSCSPTDMQFSVCVPDNPALCGGTDSRAGLNEICFAPGLGD